MPADAAAEPATVRPAERVAGAPPVIRSYRHRRGRMGATSAAALDRLGGLLIPVDGRGVDVAALFGRVAPVVVEIGCGMGDATAVLAAGDPGRDILAVDVHRQGLARLLRRVEEQGLTNVRVAEGDAMVLLQDMLPPGALDEVRLFFPDPWPKARHAKRRLVQAGVLALVASRLRAGGVLHVATDWPPYAEHVRGLLAQTADFQLLYDGPRPAERPVTRFEQRGLDAGRPVTDLISRRVGS